MTDFTHEQMIHRKPIECIKNSDLAKSKLLIFMKEMSENYLLNETYAHEMTMLRQIHN